MDDFESSLHDPIIRLGLKNRFRFIMFTIPLFAKHQPEKIQILIPKVLNW